MAEGNGHRFTVELSGAVRDQYQGLLRAASGAVGRDAIRAAMRQIVRRLQIDPHLAGEPIRHLPHARLTVRRLAVAPLYVEYGVHDEQPLVIIRRVVALTDG